MRIGVEPRHGAQSGAACPSRAGTDSARHGVRRRRGAVRGLDGGRTRRQPLVRHSASSGGIRADRELRAHAAGGVDHRRGGAGHRRATRGGDLDRRHDRKAAGPGRRHAAAGRRQLGRRRMRRLVHGPWRGVHPACHGAADLHGGAGRRSTCRCGRRRARDHASRIRRGHRDRSLGTTGAVVHLEGHVPRCGGWNGTFRRGDLGRGRIRCRLIPIGSSSATRNPAR